MQNTSNEVSSSVDGAATAINTLTNLVDKQELLEKLQNVSTIVCYECSKPLDRPLMCSRCHFVNYCSRECQLKSWNSEHRIQCKLVIPLIADAAKAMNAPYKIVLRSPKWGIHMVATRAIGKGDMILCTTPMIFVSAFKRQEIQEDMVDIQKHMLIGDTRIEDVITYDHKVFGREFPCKSTRARMTYLLLCKHLPLFESHFFETGLLGDETEQQEIKALLAYLLKKMPRNPVWTLEQVAFAYCMMRQCNVEFLENIQNRSFIGEAFAPTIACVNHSCAANAMLIYGDSGKLYMFATRDIAKDEQIFRDYINNNSDVLYWDSRRRMLKSRFHFICKCTRCEAEFVDANVTKKQSHPEPTDKDAKAASADKPRLPYVDQNIPQNILAKLAHADKDPDYVKAIVLSIAYDQDLKRYLFHSDWPLFYSLVSDCMRYELAKNFGLKKNADNDAYDRLLKITNTNITRRCYISIIEEFLVHVQLSLDDDDERLDTDTGKTTHKRQAIFHLMRICLILFGYLTELSEADKHIEQETAKQEALERASDKNYDKKKTRSTFFKIPIWYHNYYSKLVLQEDRSKIETSIDALGTLLHDSSSHAYSNRPMTLAFLAVDIVTAPHIFSIFNYYIYQIETMLTQERLFANTAHTYDKDAAAATTTAAVVVEPKSPMEN